MTTTTVSLEAVANRIAKALSDHYDYTAGGICLPKPTPDFDGHKMVIIWDEGPYEWPFDDASREVIKSAIGDDLIYVESLTHYSVALYVTDADGYTIESESFVGEETSGGVCEDAPCCGCCGRSVYGSESSTYYSGDDYDPYEY